MLKPACFCRGIEVIEVSPACTSTIGAVNYARRRGISAHARGALTFARRGFGPSERPAPGAVEHLCPHAPAPTPASAYPQGIGGSMCGRNGLKF
jgi:hypothetical protein